MNDESSAALFRRADRWPPPRYAGVAPLAMEHEPGEDTAGLAAVIGGNVRKLRKQHGLSLETLAQRSHVSRAMLSQIELGRSTPTIAVLWKIAYALEAPISAFWALHLTGVPPRTVRGRTIETRWVPACLRWCGRHYTRSLDGDEIFVAHRFVSDGEFKHPVEHHSTAAGTAAVEAEHELVQVAD